MPKIIHYRNKCIGCNSCIEHAPKFWSISKEDGKSDLKGAEKKGDTFVLKISDVEVARNKSAAKDCPVKIIKVLP